MIRGIATKAVCDERDMMPNSNYIKGVVLEREVVNLFKTAGCTAARTAGSHGKYDLYVIGDLGQIEVGKAALEIEGFRPSKEGYVRKGIRYTDTLHWMCIGDGITEAVFIQCKRKEKTK